MELLSPSEKRYLLERLRSQHGVEDAFEGLVLLKAGQGRIRAVTREAFELAQKLRKVQQVGLYVVKLMKGDAILSIEGSQLLNGDIKKNVIDLDERLAREWMKAAPIESSQFYTSKYVVAKCGNLYLGSGRFSRDGRIYPQVAKWRRIPGE